MSSTNSAKTSIASAKTASAKNSSKKTASTKSAGKATGVVKKAGGEVKSTPKSIPQGKFQLKKSASSATAFAGSFARATEVPVFSMPSGKEIVNASKVVIHQSKAALGLANTVLRQRFKLPAKPKPFAGWTSSPTDADIENIQKARKEFSVDNT